MTRLQPKQFNMVNGPQGYTGPDGASDERRLGKAYVQDMATINEGGDASYFPGQGTSQGKFFHDPKPHDAVRWQRGYTPERQQVVHDMIAPPQTYAREPRPYSEATPQTKARKTEAEWDKQQADQIARGRMKTKDNAEVRAEFVGHVARSSAPNEDLARLRRDPDAEGRYGITVGTMVSARDQDRAAGQIQHGREIEMMPFDKRKHDETPEYRAQTALHELGHALDHVDRRASGRPDYIENNQRLRSPWEDDKKTEAIRDLGRMEGAADIYSHRHAISPDGTRRTDGYERDYPTGAYSSVYGSDTGYRNNRAQNKFTPEETKAFRGGYQEEHKAAGIKSPSKRQKAKEKAEAASREATTAAWGEAGRPMQSKQPQLQWEDPIEGPDMDERRATQRRNEERRIPWRKF